jgi:CheY-like chemotaxis protein
MTQRRRPPFVLFADDDPDTLIVMCAAARRRGWICDTAATAREILEKFNEHCGSAGTCYDAFVMDINFRNDPHKVTHMEPRLTGITAAKEIRRQFANIPIVFYTGSGNTLVQKQAERAGGLASEFIVKPADIFKVLDRVEILMSWVARSDYMGAERRRSGGVNLTLHSRRATDHRAEVPPVIEQALEHVRRAANDG